MGLLDNKTRFIDTIITDEGKKQLALGNLRIKFVSYTDCESVYTVDAASGSVDASQRVYFEACNLPQDQTTFKSDFSGKIAQFSAAGLSSLGGKIVSSSSDTYSVIVTGSRFIPEADRLLESSVDNFKKLFLIRTDESFYDEDREFNLNTNDVEFHITDSTPFMQSEINSMTLEHAESLYQDKRLSHVDDFKYLPPINKVHNDGKKNPLGDYPKIGQRVNELTYDELLKSLKNKQRAVIEFSQTSVSNNVVCQMFELKQDDVTKLTVIDYGELRTDDNDSLLKRVFFVGKLFIDVSGAQTFVNMFTLVFD